MYLKPLKEALLTLEEGLNHPNLSNDLLLRDGVIQRYEYTFELCWKELQAFLKRDDQSSDPLSYSKKDLFRVAARKGLIRDTEVWFEFLEARNQVSHAYDEEKANFVFNVIKKFPTEMTFLLNNLEASNDEE